MTVPSTGEAPALAVIGMSVAYGDVTAVHDATFSIAPGEACAITGPNGNGKSSILMGLAGLVRRRGDVRIFGAPAPSGDVRWAARHGLTLVPERRQLYPGLSAADNIVLGCYCWTSSLRKARTSRPFGLALELFPEIGPRLKQQAGTLSGGQQQMVAIMRGLASDPKILAVDEPCLGLAEAVARRVYDALARIHEAGTTLGSMRDWLAAASKGTSPEASQTAAGLQAYFAGMKSAGYTSANQLDNSQEGWDAGLEINWAVTSAGTLDETTVMHKLQHLDINTLGIVWARTPANYENITQVLAAMETIAPDGTVTLFNK